MRLINNNLQINLSMEENCASVLIVENKNTYANILKNLYVQIKGEEGEFILSKDEKEISFSKKAIMVFNPFEISCNDRKVISKLYQEIKDIAMESFQEETSVLFSKNIAYVDKILNQVPYNLDYDLEFNFLDFLKLMNVRIDEMGESILERVVEFIKVQSRICGLELFIFVGLKNYLDIEELGLLYKEVFNEHVFLIDIETHYDELLCDERVFIIDGDNCIIELE